MEMTVNGELKNKYQLCDEIGRGRFGVIYRCFSPISGDYFACKTIDKRLLTDSLERECLENEPKIMAILPPHPNIVQIHDMFETYDFLSIVMQLCNSAVTLYDFVISSAGDVSETRAALYMKQILMALSHCHEFGVVHRDVKPENILLDSGNDSVLLCDFGSAKWLGSGVDDEESGRSTVGIVGTPYYVAPEVLMGREYDEKVDVWSAGVVLYTMLAGILPFHGETGGEIFEAVLRGNLRFPPKIFKSVSKEAKDLVKKMICRDPSTRFSANQALKHPWILNGGETISMDS